MLKRKLQFFAIISLAIFVTACVGTNAVTNGHGIQKRKYTKGFYLEKNSSTASVDLKEKSQSKSAMIEFDKDETSEFLTSNSAEDVAETNTDNIVENTETPKESEKEENVVNRSQSEEAKSQNISQKRVDRVIDEENFLKKRFKRVQKNVKEITNKRPGNVPMILLVILAILLPPLAVYLVQGASAMFWVTLILCILSGGFFFSPYIGGLWLIAVILALLVVLGVI